jgi:hypothetical protein
MNALNCGKARTHSTPPAAPGWSRCQLRPNGNEAARGGTQTRFSYGDALDCLDGQCTYCSASLFAWWCGNNSPEGSKPVGQKAPNQFGVHDMHGGAREWTYAVGAYTSTPKVDP